MLFDHLYTNLKYNLTCEVKLRYNLTFEVTIMYYLPSEMNLKYLTCEVTFISNLTYSTLM